MEKVEAIKFWKERIEEIKETGNCKNGNVHGSSPYFGGVRFKYTQAEMIAYCEAMIEKVKNN